MTDKTDYLDGLRKFSSGFIFANDDLRRDDLSPTIRALIAERDALKEDAERLDSGVILMHEWDEFGQPSATEHRGVNLREAIDAARALVAHDAARSAEGKTP